MLIKFGSMVVAGRGKLGGQVYSHNRTGDYVRNNAIPVNPKSQTQMASRALLAQFSQAWGALTQAQRDAWDAATENYQRKNVFGDNRKLSGKNLYTSLNKNLVAVGGTAYDSPNLPADVITPSSVTASAGITAGTFNVQYAGSGTAKHTVFIATPPVSAGKLFVKNELRVVSHTDGLAPDTDQDIKSDYEARFGALAEGQVIWVGCYSVNDNGQRSVQTITRIEVAA